LWFIGSGTNAFYRRVELTAASVVKSRPVSDPSESSRPNRKSYIIFFIAIGPL